jgi:hypothetical protein
MTSSTSTRSIAPASLRPCRRRWASKLRA